MKVKKQAGGPDHMQLHYYCSVNNNVSTAMLEERLLKRQPLQNKKQQQQQQTIFHYKLYNSEVWTLPAEINSTQPLY